MGSECFILSLVFQKQEKYKMKLWKTDFNSIQLLKDNTDLPHDYATGLVRGHLSHAYEIKSLIF